jgi:cation diffusion facilitator family transporter
MKSGHQHDHGHEHGHEHGHDHGHSGGLWGPLRSVFRPHSHDTADRIDSALATSREGIRAVTVSLAILGLTAALQLAVVLVTGSVALLADMTHNVADALTAVPIGVALMVGRRPANRRYTYGYGRGEDIAGLLVLVAVTASSALAAYQAVDRLINPRPLTNLGLITIAGIIGFAGNETVATYRIRVGRRIGSAALVADGLHARTDGLTSLAVVAGAAGVAAGWPAADPIAGLTISVAILAVLVQAAREVFGRMMDRVDDTTVAAATEAAGAVAGVTGVDRLRMRWVGHDLLAEVDVTASAHLSLPQAHDIAEAVRHRLRRTVHRLADATVHVSPTATVGVNPHEASGPHVATRGI